jgi:hypothetical protein
MAIVLGVEDKLMRTVAAWLCSDGAAPGEKL